MDRKTDKYGHKLDCEFILESKKGIECTALNDFYSADIPKHQCSGCPFYKKRTV